MISTPLANYYDEAPSRNRETVNMQNFYLGQNILINQDYLINELRNIDYKNDQDLHELIRISYPIILDIDFINKANHKIELAKAFMNIRFVSVFCAVISSVALTDIQRICCNKFIYDYFTMTSEKNDMIINHMLNLGFAINKDHVVGLYGKGIDQKTITNLAVARFSTTDDILAVKRANVIIMNSTPQMMTEQIIVNIYETLFNKCLVALFNGVMFDTMEFDDDEIDEDQEEIYATISLAILDILNEMPTDMIIAVLKAYAQTKQYCHQREKARFDIHAISEEYDRVLSCVYYLESSGFTVPRR